MLGAALLLGAALSGAWLLPGMLDLTRYRESVAVFASERLGREVRITGPISLVLLPQPILVAGGVSVADAGDGGIVRADELRLRVGLGALLTGRLDARELVLRGLDVQMPWPMPPGSYRLRTPGWLASVAARIEGGRLSVGSLAFSGINATLNVDALTGSIATAGTAKFSGLDWHVTARMTEAGRDGAAGIDVTLDGQGRVLGVGASLSAQIDAQGALSGRLMARGPDLSRLLPAQVLPIPAVPFKAESRVRAADGLVVANDMVFDIGGSLAQAAVSLRLAPAPRLDVMLSAGRLDLDAWSPFLLEAIGAGITAGLDLSAEAVQVAGGTLRRVQGAIEFDQGGLTLRSLHAILPGSAALQLSGRLTRSADAGPDFDGTFTLAANAARTTLGWLVAAHLVPDVLPDGVLRQADLSGRMAVRAGTVELTSLTGTVDGHAIAGRLAVRSGERPRVEAALTMDRLALDPWLVHPPSSFATLSDRFATYDADLDVTSRTATWRGQTIAPFHLDAAAAAGRVTLRLLEMDSAGVHAAATGVVDAAGHLSNGHLVLQTQDATPLAGFLPTALAAIGRDAPTLWHAPARLRVAATGPADALATQVDFDLGDLRIEASPLVNLATWRAAGPITLRHPGVPRLADALGLGSVRAWLGEGSLALAAQINAASGRVAAETIVLTAGSLHAGGALALDTGDVPRLSGELRVESLPLVLPDLHAADPLAVVLVRGWQADVKLAAEEVAGAGLPPLTHATATVRLHDGVLSLDSVAASVADGRLGGSLTFDSAAEPPTANLLMTLTGSNIGGPLFGTTLDVTSGALDVEANLTARGFAPATMLASLAGEIRISVRSGVLAGIDLAKTDPAGTGDTSADGAVRQALERSNSAFDRLEIAMAVNQGSLRLTQGELTSAIATASLGGRIDLPDDTADLRLMLHPATPDPPTLGLRLFGRLDALRRVPELDRLAVWRSTHPATVP